MREQKLMPPRERPRKNKEKALLTMTSTSSRLTSGGTATALVVGVVAVGGLYLLHNNRKRREKNASEKQKCDEQEVDTCIMMDDSIPRDLLFDTTMETEQQDDEDNTNARILSRGTITIAHASVTGTCKALAETLQNALLKANLSNSTVQLCKTDDFDWWDELLNNEDEDSSLLSPPMLVLILPTHANGSWPTTSQSLQSALQDLKHDWRIEKQPLRSSGLQVATFGMGSSAYDDATMGLPAKEAYRDLRELGAKMIATVGIGDDAVGNAAQEAFSVWMENVVSSIQDLVAPSSCACGSTPSNGGCCQTEVTNGTFDEHQEYYSDDDEDDQKEPDVMDLEDIGDSMMAQEEKKQDTEVQEMVTPSQAAALKKEGYKLIGTHSAVKLCRWTKHQLRGRGGCYKHTFYGITSYQCMEATPSLACANKCTYMVLLWNACTMNRPVSLFVYDLT